MRLIRPAEVEAGDVVAYDWDGDGAWDHMGLATAGREENEGIPSVEGNADRRHQRDGVRIERGGARRGAAQFVVIRVSKTS